MPARSSLKPTIFLMDEPASGLVNTETERGYLLLDIRAAGVAILLIGDLRLVIGISDHLVVMNHGKERSPKVRRRGRSDPQVVAAMSERDR